MIKEIKELNFPKKDGKQYATLTAATVTLQDMGDKTITSTVKFDGDITPDFSYDWAVEFQGEKYIMPLRKPQGAKENTSMLATVDLTFQHWAIYWLKQNYFFQYTSVAANTVIPDKFVVPLNLNLGNFCEYLKVVLSHWYGDRITVDFNDYKTHAGGWMYKEEPTRIDISYTKIWDVLLKIHELYGVRWTIEPNGNIERYVIKIGYPSTEVSHIFEYGFEGGLLKVERQVQSDRIANLLMGRGGSKNLPYRYFKDTDPDNKTFPKDPDWIPELAAVPFTELRGATFRSYIQGWKHAHYNGANNRAAAYAQWAWDKGNTDTKFDPVEYVKDDDSIAMYGQLWDALDNNEEIYPSIQEVSRPGLGRIDEVVAVEEITSDDIDQAAENDAQIQTLPGLTSSVAEVPDNRYHTFTMSGKLTVPPGKTGNLIVEGVTALGRPPVGASGKHATDTYTGGNGLVIGDPTVSVKEISSAEEYEGSGIPAGDYKYTVSVQIQNTSGKKLSITAECPTPKLSYATLDGKWVDTWNIWVKDMWGVSRLTGENDIEYTERVWRPILGDREGNEAKVVFSDGWLSTSEDYEFTIVKNGVHYDTGKTLYVFNDGRVSNDASQSAAHGGIAYTYQSRWRLTLSKSDADLKATGKYVPSTMRQASTGDHFFFTGIELPWQYWIWAEERLDEWKKDHLNETLDVKQAWVVALDKVKIHNYGNAGAIVDSLKIGNSIRLADKRFVTMVNSSGVTVPSSPETLYLQSVTYSYIEPTDKESNLLPDVEIVLNDRYETVANPVGRLEGEVSALQKQVGGLSNIEQVARAVGDKLYLRKDGFPDRSMSPTEFGSLVTSTGFRAGMMGGRGWGFYKDENGNWVLETDRINARQDLQVNTLVYNHVEGRGGMWVESAAALEISKVENVRSGFRCSFDQKQGSVVNKFTVDDVAWCMDMSPDGRVQKNYRRRVVAVGDDYVILSITDKNGDGEPEPGDTIVHFGNYTDGNRQYVKIGDVVDGGYERYIEGLDSVDAQGEEYYFVGRQTGQYGGRPRWFVGDAVSYMEYKEGVLNLVNVGLRIRTQGGPREIEEYVKGEAQKATDRVTVGVRNLLTGTAQEYKTNDDISPVDWATYFPQVHTTVDLVNGETYTIRGRSTGEWTGDAGHSEGVATAPNDLVTMWLVSSSKFQVVSDSGTGSAKGTTFVWTQPDGKYFLRLNSYGREHTFSEIMLVKGNKIASEWNAAPEDAEERVANQIGALDYLRKSILDARNEETAVEGGLILATLLRLGYTTDETGYVVRSGINGRYSRGERGGGIAVWAGGEMVDAGALEVTGAMAALSEKTAAERTVTPAAFVIRQDGTAYFANNVVKIGERELSVGKNVWLDDRGLRLTVDNETVMEIANDEISTDFSKLSSNVTYNQKPVRIDLGLTVSDGELVQTGTGAYDRVSLGSVESGSQLTLTVGTITAIQDTVEYSGDYESLYPYGGLLFVKLFKSTGAVVDERTMDVMVNVQESTDQYGQTTKTFFYTCVGGSFSWIIDSGGTYMADIYFSGATGEGSVVDTVEFTGTVSWTTKAALGNKTVLGRNGMSVVRSQTALAINDDAVIMRAGNYGLRLTAGGGIQKTVNGGGSWAPL